MKKLRSLLVFTIMNLTLLSQNNVSNQLCNMRASDTLELFNNSWVNVCRINKYSNDINISNLKASDSDRSYVYQFSRNGIEVFHEKKLDNFYKLNFLIEESYPNCFIYYSDKKNIMEKCEWSPILIKDDVMLVNIYCCKYSKRRAKKNKCSYKFLETRIFIKQ